ncbi:MAG: cell division topological specificity factor MinE [Snodgrassella sp.]|jgi:cell division topological specificity factor|uniref:cell division topological specificity factor MinE n=1 Tax=Snodgrassella communis TaxID=2946699 RepID=UPI000C1E3BCC|nr:cell division topological specificity factor MinE [Snodgrassella communis]MCO6515238.1 cell division topological specificity factor MinE [Snodgrassella sp.]PIT19377.1 cell division topological specificity factor MinE [Snodgrassella communis]PIT22350.1 cell division topological specificity factor MinE [Snodgrassella communis]
MSIMDFLFGKKQQSAQLARDRLQIIIAQERATQAPDYLPTLQKELLEVLSKYVHVSLNDIHIAQEKKDGMDVLALNITLPETGKKGQ